MTDVDDSTGRRRGRLRVYLGAAPGVGKTFAMLDEGHRRLERGADVVVGVVETHGRAGTEKAAAGLEVLPRLAVEHRGVRLEELDVDAILARQPNVVLVDELAHTNAPGSARIKRWQDVDALLDAGIDVVTTVNVQHLESLNDVVFEITGIRQTETVPDHVVRAADQIELVDMSPQALRKRLAHGNVYAPEKVDAALTNYFREGNLTALREIALLWLADRVDAALDQYRRDNDISTTWRTRERVVVALAGGPEGDALVRRGIRIVDRASGGQLFGVHVADSDGLVVGGADDLTRQRRLIEQAGGTFHVVAGSDVAKVILDFAEGVNASQIVVGESTRSRFAAAFSLTDTRGIIRGSGEIDVLVVTHGGGPTGRQRRRNESMLSVRRRTAGWILAVVGTPLMCWLIYLAGGGGPEDLSFAMMFCLALTLAVALLGGLWPALVAALLGALATNLLFVDPLFTLTIAQPREAVAVALLFVVAVVASRVVSRAAARTREAAAARAEADLITSASLDVIAGNDALEAILARLREAFGLDGVVIAGADGAVVCADPREASGEGETMELEDGATVTLFGPAIEPREARVLMAVAAQVIALAARRDAARERELALEYQHRGDVRGAILAAVSHDLRTPLAAITASASALTSPQLSLSAEDSAELLDAIRTSADRLQSLVDNLLDMTRIEAGIVPARAAPVWIMDVLIAACAGVNPERVELDVPASAAQATVDGGLLERVLANLIENAVRFSPDDLPVRVSAAKTATSLVFTVTDRGSGVAANDRERMFDSFQRLGDAPRGAGVGLGLAVARGLARALGGDVQAEDTPGGGLTMVVTVQQGDAT